MHMFCWGGVGVGVVVRLTWKELVMWHTCKTLHLKLTFVTDYLVGGNKWNIANIYWSVVVTSQTLSNQYLI